MRDPRRKGGDDGGGRRSLPNLDWLAACALAALVLTPRAWIGWPLQFGVAYALLAGALGGFVVLVMLEFLPKAYRYAAYVGFVALIVASFQVPWLIGSAVLCVVIIFLRLRQR